MTPTNFESNHLKPRNLILVYLVILMVPMTRVIARHSAKSAGTAAWLCPIVSGIFFGLELLCLFYIVRKNPGQNLSQLCRTCFGTVAGNIINIIVALWMIILTGYYLRQFGERMVTTVFYDSSSSIFIVAMLICVFFAMRLGPTVLLRAGSMFFYAIIAVFLLSCIALISQIKPYNLLPVTVYDSGNVALGAINMASVQGYIVTFLIYFADIPPNGFFKGASVAGGAGTFFGILTIGLPLSVFSAPVVSQMLFPFFSVAKNIKVLDSIERVEAIIVALFILADFIIISYFLMSTHKLLCDVTKTDLRTPYYSMLLLLAFGASLFFGMGSFELNEISSTLIVPMNFIIEVALIVLLLAATFIQSRKAAPSAPANAVINPPAS